MIDQFWSWKVCEAGFEKVFQWIWIYSINLTVFSVKTQLEIINLYKCVYLLDDVSKFFLLLKWCEHSMFSERHRSGSLLTSWAVVWFLHLQEYERWVRDDCHIASSSGHYTPAVERWICYPHPTTWSHYHYQVGNIPVTTHPSLEPFSMAQRNDLAGALIWN